jgi:hypothetical protein
MTLPHGLCDLAATRLTPDVAAHRGTRGGRVGAVYRAAIYVDLPGADGPGAADDLLVIALDSVGGIPSGILVRGLSDFRSIAVRRGMNLVAADRGWTIPAAGVGIDGSVVSTWSPALPAAARLVPGPALARRVAGASRIAADRARAGGLLGMANARSSDPWLARARELIAAQLVALTNGDVEAASRTTAGLIGLGVGLTPSGDDFLVGLLAGLEAMSHPLRACVATTIVEQSGRTTRIGAASLAHAARGAYAERLSDVIVALRPEYDDASRSLSTMIDRAMAFGATSGADTLAGLFAAIELSLARSRRTVTVAA